MGFAQGMFSKRARKPDTAAANSSGPAAKALL